MMVIMVSQEVWARRYVHESVLKPQVVDDGRAFCNIANMLPAGQKPCYKFLLVRVQWCKYLVIVGVQQYFINQDLVFGSMNKLNQSPLLVENSGPSPLATANTVFHRSGEPRR